MLRILYTDIIGIFKEKYVHKKHKCICTHNIKYYTDQYLRTRAMQLESIEDWGD